MKRPIPKVTLLLLAACWLTTGVAAAREESRRIAASPDGTVTILNPRGTVTIVGWERNEVAAVGRFGEAIRRMTLTRSGDEVAVAVVPADPATGGIADLEVRVPLNSRVEVRTFQAPIGIDGVTGPVDLESMSGAIVVNGGPRLLRVHCMTCDMDIHADSEVIRAESVGGAIRVKEARGVVDLSTVSGNITLVSGSDAPECPSGKGVSMSSVSGNIAYSGSLCRDSELFLETHSGAIDLNVPMTTHADLDVRCYTCTIDNESAVKVIPTLGPDGTTKEYRVFSGSGGGLVQVRSFSGPVTIRRDR